MDIIVESTHVQNQMFIVERNATKFIIGMTTVSSVHKFMYP